MPETAKLHMFLLILFVEISLVHSFILHRFLDGVLPRIAGEEWQSVCTLELIVPIHTYVTFLHMALFSGESTSWSRDQKPG
jgi:hypothetical protein